MAAMNDRPDLHGSFIPESHNAPALSFPWMKQFALMIKIS